MSDNTNSQDDKYKHIHGYNRMLERVKEYIANTEEDLATKFHYAIEAAKDKALELGELTREESEEIAAYLKRDVHDAAEYLADEGSEMRDWLRFDVQLVEAKLLDWMSLAVDTSKLEFEQLAERARQENIWMAGEITGPGTLHCTACDHEIQFLETAQIPPCPRCGKKRYKRFNPESD